MLVRRVVATLAVAALAVVAGCDEASPADGGNPDAAATSGSSTSEFPTYVALGDSYTAAPGVPQTEQQSGCFRSSGNYPNLVAAALESQLVDVSCSGATSLALVGAQRTADLVQEPQFSALTAETSLVTLGIGGNDLGLFQTMVGTCARLSSSDPSGAPCRDYMRTAGKKKDLLLEKIDQIRARVTSAVKGIHDRSPQAKVFLIGYPQPVPVEGTCPVLPLATGDYGYVRTIVGYLNDAMHAAARKGRAIFVDMARASAGHDICAGPDAWVNGSNTDLTRAVAFHPFAEEQQAVADLVLAKLESRD